MASGSSTSRRVSDEMTGLVERLMQDDNYWDETGRRVRDCYDKFHTPDAAMDVIYERLFMEGSGSAPTTLSFSPWGCTD